MDTTTEQSPAPKKPAKRRIKKRKLTPTVSKVKEATVKADDKFGGLTATECPYDCNANSCVISGLNVCGHPRKGGLQPAVQRDPDAMERYNAARKILAHQAVDKRV